MSSSEYSAYLTHTRNNLFNAHVDVLKTPYGAAHDPIMQILRIFIAPVGMAVTTFSLGFVTASLMLKVLIAPLQALFGFDTNFKNDLSDTAESLTTTALSAASIMTLPIANAVGFFTRAVASLTEDSTPNYDFSPGFQP